MYLNLYDLLTQLFLQSYRMITGLVARPWCLVEICSKQDIINIVSDASTETTKIGICACSPLHPSFEVNQRFFS